MRKFTIVNADGTVAPLPENLVPFASRIAPLAASAIKSETAMEVSFRGIAEIIGEFRMGHSFAGDPAGSKRALPKSEFDYRGLSPECSKGEAQIWSAVVPADHLAKWQAATRKSQSDYPLRKKVAYHLEIVIKELFAKNNPTLDGTVEANGNMTGDLAEAFEKVTGMNPASRSGRGNGKGKDNPLSDLANPTKDPAKTLKTLGGILAKLTAANFAEIHGSERRTAINALKAIALHATNVASDLESATKPVKADARRTRAAEAA